MAFINPSDSENPIVRQGEREVNRSLPLLVVPENDAERGELFRRLHYLLWQQVGRCGDDERNPIKNYRLFQGYLDQERHDDAMAPEGIQGISKLENYSFFSANEGILTGIFQEAGLSFSTTTKGPAWEDQRRENAIKVGAEAVMRSAASKAAEMGGQPMNDVLTDESVYVPDDPNELLEKLPFQQQLEHEVYLRLEEDLELTGAQQKLMDSLRDKFIVEKQIMLVAEKNGHVDIEPVRVDQCGWWGKANARTAEDMDAWVVQDTLTPTGVLAQYGDMLTDDEAERIQLRGATSDNRNVSVRDWDRYTDPALNRLMPDDTNRPAGTPAQGPFGDVVRQRLFVRLIKKMYYLVLTDVNGEGERVDLREITKEEHNAYRNGTYGYVERLQYQRVTKERAEELKRLGSTSIRQVRMAEMWESVALQDVSWGIPTLDMRPEVLAHGTYVPGMKVISSRAMPWQEREPSRLTMPKFPIVAFFGDDESLVSRGRPLHEMYTNIYIILRRAVALSGSNAVGYDVSQKPKGMTWEQIRFTANQAGLYLYNGKRDSGGNANRTDGHLRAINLSADNNIERLVNLATMLRTMFDQMCGINDALKGRFGARETTGQTQMGITRGMMATHRLFVENNLFVTEVFNRMVSLGKYLWPSSSSPRAKGATFDVVRQIPINYYGVYLENSLKQSQDQAFMMDVMKQALAAGKASLAEVVQMYFAKSPQERLSIFEDGMSAQEKIQQQLGQQGAQAQQAQAAAAQLKAMMPKTVAEIQVAGALELEELRQGGLSSRNDETIQFNQDKSDIDTEATARQSAAHLQMQQNVAEGQTL